MSNSGLNLAKKIKNDEFYTQYDDIVSELKYYTKCFKNKAVFCNCDDPAKSNFWRYFCDNFKQLKLKKLISIHYAEKSYALIYQGKDKLTKLALHGDGDFRSKESIEYLKQCDIVVTNPPFSLAREYVKQLFAYHKKFLIIGNMTWIAYKEIFPLLRENKMWLGINNVKGFIQPNGTIKKFGNICWFTNLSVLKPANKLKLKKHFNIVNNPIYDNYSAFEVAKVINIPQDNEIQVQINKNDLSGWQKVYRDDLTVIFTNDKMALVNIKRPIWSVPITFLNKYNPHEFNIIGEASGNSHKTKLYGNVYYKHSKLDRGGCCVINNVRKYNRIFIRAKKED